MFYLVLPVILTDASKLAKRARQHHWEVLISIQFEWLIPVKPSIFSLHNMLPLLIFHIGFWRHSESQILWIECVEKFPETNRFIWFPIPGFPGMSLKLCHDFQDSCYTNTVTSIKLVMWSCNKNQVLFLRWCKISEVIVPLIQALIFFPIDTSRKIFLITERRGKSFRAFGSLLSKGCIRRLKHLLPLSEVVNTS